MDHTITTLEEYVCGKMFRMLWDGDMFTHEDMIRVLKENIELYEELILSVEK